MKMFAACPGKVIVLLALLNTSMLFAQDRPGDNFLTKAE